MKKSKQRRLKTQLLRHRRVEVVRRDRVEDVQDDHEEEDLEPNVDVEVVVDEVLEVDLLQLSKTMSKRTMKLAKSMSMLEVDAIDGRLEERDLVEEDCVEGSWQSDGDGDASLWLGWLVVVGMQRGVGCDDGSATMSKWVLEFRSEGCSKLGCSEVVGESLSSPCMLSLVIMVSSMFATVVVVVLLAASCRCTLFYWMHLEPRQQFDEVVFDKNR